MSQIWSQISPSVLHFNNSPVLFEVIVKNISSQYASFKVDLTAAGANPNLKDDWYSLDPITSTLIPPGDSTKFSVKILDLPVLGMDLIQIEIRVSSVELPDINYHPLKLFSTETTPQLRVYLPVESFAIYPRKKLEIPVLVTNLSQNKEHIVVKLKGLNSSWLAGDNERRLTLEARMEGEIKFICQPPIAKKAPSGFYHFVVSAGVKDREWGKAKGTIEILPIGEVRFFVTPEQNTLPTQTSWLPQFNNKPANYQLELKNISNVAQKQITVSLEDAKCDYQVIPSFGEAKLGETIALQLETRKKRHWWGGKRKYPLKILPSLSDLSLGNTDPSSREVELWVMPILPLWLQLFSSAISVAIVVYILSLFSVSGHRDRINSVTFSSDINPVLSSSKDGTVKEWRVSPDNLFCQWLNWQRFCLQYRDTLWNSEKTGTSDQVNVVELRTENSASSKFAFLGFDSGKVSRLNILTQEAKTIIDAQNSTNRVLDITLDPDFATIFIGRGTGLLKFSLVNNNPQNLIEQKTSIYVVTFTPNYENIVAGGQYNNIFFIDPNDSRTYNKPNIVHPTQNKEADRITGVEFTESNLLISTDNRGLVRIWDFNKCQNEECEFIYEYREKGTSINAIALARTKQDKDYLVTGDANGNLKIWLIDENSNSEMLKLQKTIKYSQAITSIDLIDPRRKSSDRLLILSGSKDSRVRLNIYKIPQ